MKLVSWNVNGLRACMGKGFEESVRALDPDVICLQETKMQNHQVAFEIEGYHMHFYSAEKKGYSGTAVFSKEKPASLKDGLGIPEHDGEGRAITADFGDFYLVNCYVPNSQDGLRRLEYRMTWDDALREYLVGLNREKPVILCGDLNVAHQEIDLKNPKTNRMNAGFTDQERAKFGELLRAGFIDSFRHFYPEATGAYSWWSYIGNARSRNAGWRIDYFCVSGSMVGRLLKASIHADIYGSDHCPVSIEIG